ncbi:hypothetical protein HMPREF0484_1031 [Klebsiella pneumoniae subsp. rhinoscleromatis ATCC 13884]|uniref:hypothetical protein n=1 Tax=Klebsiella pneumoniae TaxID=573 RepID=UPI0001B767F5|nr:hypothetical protein [Klebsiella pneumoniae]EEW42913.1 hypothetical protein HMPREF0484_1031 [Klebsiella pneumoniae subsp. rhinoscleromatis ATCC 13884]
MCESAQNRITHCIRTRDNRQALSNLHELAETLLDTIIVVEFEGGKTHLNYGGRSAEEVIAMLKELHLEGHKA